MFVHLQNVKKTYVAPDGTMVPVIDVPTLNIESGEHIALVGTSGSGKTTLLHMIAGILVPDSGRIIFGTAQRSTSQPGVEASSGSEGIDYRTSSSVDSGAGDITALTEAERDVFRGAHLGYIFQTHHLLPGFTAMENVLLGMTFTGRPHDPGWAKHLLHAVGLADRLDYKPEKLSVGQQQRVAVARALANRPGLVLADEPTGALDTRNAQQVLELIRSLCKDVDAALLVVTHDPNIANQFPRVLNLMDVNRAASPVVATL